MIKKLIVPTLSILFLTAVAVSCTPEQVAIYHTLNPSEQAAVHDALNPPKPQHSPPGGFLACVRAHESGGNYQAKNPHSTASGAYQFLNSTWRTMSARAGHGGYPTARSAPPWVQDAVAIYTVNAGWRSAWNGTGC
jgi:hypothetical protein